MRARCAQGTKGLRSPHMDLSFSDNFRTLHKFSSLAAKPHLLAGIFRDTCSIHDGNGRHVFDASPCRTARKSGRFAKCIVNGDPTTAHPVQRVPVAHTCRTHVSQKPRQLVRFLRFGGRAPVSGVSRCVIGGLALSVSTRRRS